MSRIISIETNAGQDFERPDFHVVDLFKLGHLIGMKYETRAGNVKASQAERLRDGYRGIIEKFAAS
jgi:hypothetical protein